MSVIKVGKVLCAGAVALAISPFITLVYGLDEVNLPSSSSQQRVRTTLAQLFASDPHTNIQHESESSNSNHLQPSPAEVDIQGDEHIIPTSASKKKQQLARIKKQMNFSKSRVVKIQYFQEGGPRYRLRSDLEPSKEKSRLYADAYLKGDRERAADEEEEVPSNKEGKMMNR